MKIFGSQILKDIDNATCQAQKINSIDLMERAATAVSCELISRFLPSQRIVVFAGPGNNGGDALAVARMLIEQGYKKVEIFLFNIRSKLSYDCGEEKNRLISIDDTDFTEVTGAGTFTPPYLCKSDVVVDGLFGSGLNEPLQGGFAMLARYINESEAYVVSIDMPSGLFCEPNARQERRNIVHASLTLTFQMPRLSFFFAENEEIIGEWKLLDIELDEDIIKSTPATFYLIEPKTVRPMLKPRRKFTGKRDYGSVMIIAGSMGMMGAAVMAARAAMRSGAGLVTVHSARCGYEVVQTAIPEAMFEPDRNDRFITDMRLHHDHSVVAVGPGINTNDDTVNALEGLLKNCHAPLVIDADALNCIAKRPALLTMIPPLSVITPHIGEFDRLFGIQHSSEDRLLKGIEISKTYNLIIVLKGHYTAVIRPDGRVFFNPTGNPGMATAGAGDVLTGVIAAFIAQGLKPEIAATVGVFIHGLAGDLATESIGERGIIASDINDYIGRAIRQVSDGTVSINL